MTNNFLVKFVKDWFWVVLAGVFILAFALYLRTVNVNSLPIFADEAIYVRWSQVMKAEPTLRFLPVSDGKQPLFMWVTMPFLKIISDPLVAGRTLSALSGIGTLVGIFVLSYLLFENKKLSLLAILFYSVSPYSVFFDRMALVDSMLSMFGVWTLVFAILTAKSLRLDLAMITGFTLGGALLTKSPALFFVILLPTTILFSNLGNAKDRVFNLAKLGILWGVSIAIGYGMYNVLRLGPNFSTITSRNQDYVYPITHILESPLDPFKPFLDRSFEWISTLGPWLILLFAGVGFLANFRKKGRQVSLLILWFLVPIFVQSEFAKVFTARYIYFTLPYLMILAASILIPTKRFGKVFGGIVTIGLLLFIVQALSFDKLLLTDINAAPLPRSERSGYLEEWTSGTGIREASFYLRNEQANNPGEKIVVGTEGYFGTLPDGLQAYLNDIPEITVIGVGINFQEIPSSLIESKDFGNRTYLLVNSSRFRHGTSEFEKLGLKVAASWRKADRPDGFREYVQHGPYDTLYLFELVK